jgi:hypothetical protein
VEQHNQAPAPQEAVPAQVPASTELPPNGAAPPADGVVDGQQQQQPPAEAAPQPNPEEEARARSRKEQRFSELSRRANEAEREAAYWRGIAEGKGVAQNGQTPAPQPQAQNPQANGPPDPANYAAGEFDPAYIRDLARHTVREERAAMEREEAERARQTAERAQFEEAKARFVSAYEATQAEAERATDPYYQDAFDAGARFLLQLGSQRELADAIAESDDPALAAAYFAKNREHWQEIASLRPYQRAVQIDRVVAHIARTVRGPATRPAAQAQPAPQPAPTQPNQPLQATPTISGRGSTPVFDPNQGTMDDYLRWRQSQAH